MPGSNSNYDLQDPFAQGNWGGEEVWYLPPGMAFFQNIGSNDQQGVTQTAEGVNVGGMDLLDFMALDAPFGDGGSGF